MLDGLRGKLGLLLITLFDGFFLQEAEDVVEDEVAVWLLGEEEGLDELFPRVAVVRHLSDDLNDDTAVGRRLRINRVNEHLAVLEANLRDLVVDLL